MSAVLKRKYLFSIIFLLYSCFPLCAQLSVDAGPDYIICPGESVFLGGAPSASGGLAPYTYSWSPAGGLSNASNSNPSASPDDFVLYTLTVTDDTGAVQTDAVNITMSYIAYVNAGAPTDYCLKGSSVIGGLNNVSGQGIDYLWSPTAGLDDPTAPRPTVDTSQTAVYTLTATIVGCAPKIDSVVVTVIQPPPINAGSDTTIKEGERVTLHASGGFFYDWTPSWNLVYSTTGDPDAEPVTATTYYVYGMDAARRCFAYDTINVFVEPSNDVVYYNTFTPNGDGNNDTWYIGNIQKYPRNRLEIYNRNGKLVYKISGYLNTWDGKTFLGEELPPATYFYIMDLGEGAGKFHGTVTMVK
ncbi:MAG: gliding motility-associated C-terminal domain-containing protein [Bacteroidota bacterium]